MPYLLDDNTYQETENIALGKIERSSLLSEFSDWFISQYSVKILNIHFDKPRGSRGDTYALYVMIENPEDYQKLHDRPTIVQREEHYLQISVQFKRLALRYKAFDETRLDDIFVVYNDFSREAKTVANWRAAREVATHIKSTHVSVWDVVAQFWNSVVFYYTDYDIVNNERTNTSKFITMDYYNILKKYDKLNYFTRENINLKFDSKENLDNNFEGNLFYYSR